MNDTVFGPVSIDMLERTRIRKMVIHGPIAHPAAIKEKQHPTNTHPSSNSILNPHQTESQRILNAHVLCGYAIFNNIIGIIKAMRGHHTQQTQKRCLWKRAPSSAIDIYDCIQVVFHSVSTKTSINIYRMTFSNIACMWALTIVNVWCVTANS